MEAARNLRGPGPSPRSPHTGSSVQPPTGSRPHVRPRLKARARGGRAPRVRLAARPPPGDHSRARARRPAFAERHLLVSVRLSGRGNADIRLRRDWLGVPARHRPRAWSGPPELNCPDLASLRPMSVRAVRGATQLEEDDRDHMLDRVAEMVLDVMESNDLAVDDFISVIFTGPPTWSRSSRRTPRDSSGSARCR